jgi:predicted DNA-binding protein
VKKETLEEVQELQQILGVLHTRLNNLVHKLGDPKDLSYPKEERETEINPSEMDSLYVANKALAEAW